MTELLDYRTCDDCDKVEYHEESSPYDWVNGVCEECDPSILYAPENAWRVELGGGYDLDD